MYWFIALISLFAMAVDVLFYRLRIRRRVKSRAGRIAFVCFVLVSDLMPAFILLLYRLLPDNPTPAVKAAMWLMFIYLLTLMPRLAYYLVSLLGRRPAVRLVAMAAALGCVALLVWGAVHGRRAIVVNRVAIVSDRLPEAFRGLRIVQFSDTHIGSMVNSRRELRALVDTINSLRPDLVVFSGDLVNIRYTELDPPAREILGAIHAPFGVISTLGNHDVGIYVKDTVALPPEVNTERLIGLQREMGWNMLLDSTVYLHRGGDSISLSGISFDRSMYRFRHTADVPIPGLEPVYGGVPAELFNVTVSHLPQLRHNIADLGYGDLILAGHVHSMQVKMRIGKRRFSPAQWFYDEWSGLYDNDGHRLYINDGIGYVGFPMRLGAYPEVTLFVLER